MTFMAQIYVLMYVVYFFGKRLIFYVSVVMAMMSVVDIYCRMALLFWAKVLL